jgi:4-nitrophenyl phosphatase
VRGKLSLFLRAVRAVRAGLPDCHPVTWLLDLDGVVWLAGRPIPGAASAIDRLHQAGERVLYFTNNSGPTVPEYLAQLRAVGGGASSVTAEDLLTSAQAAASLLSPGSSAAVVGGAGVHEALSARRVRVVAPPGHGGAGHPDAVVVGRTVDLSYDALAAAATAIRAGATFVATNTDATFPTPDGPVPGAGAIVAFLETASGCHAIVAGKPAAPAAQLVKERVGDVAVVVGDRPDTDGLFARAIGARFALVLSGVTHPDDLPVVPVPDVVGADLAAVVDELIDG